MPEFPKHFTRGRSKVTVYGPTEGDHRFRVIWRQNRKRRERKFTNYRDAKDYAANTVALLEAGQMPSVSLSQDQVSEYVTASGVTQRQGYGLLTAVREWSTAKEMLPAGHSLADAVKAYCERRADSGVSVPDLVDAYLEHQAPRLKAGYRRQTESLLRRFKRAFQIAIEDLQNQQLIDFLDAQKVSDKTRANHSGILSGLITWAIKRDYLAADTGLRFALKGSYKPRVLAVSFYSPEEFRRLIQVAGEGLQNRWLLAGLCGVRSEEALRVTHRDIKDGWLAIEADKAKTGRRRLVQLPERLRERLQADQEFGDALSVHAFYPRARRAHLAAEVEPKRNGLRHSFISYRLALTKDANGVAHEAGTSVEKINSNYRELVTPAEAEEWFSIQF